MSTFIDVGTGGPEQVFYHYQNWEKWVIFDANENVSSRRKLFKNDEFPIQTRCGTRTILFGIPIQFEFTQNLEKFGVFEKLKQVEIDYEDFSVKYFIDRKKEWIKSEYDLSPVNLFCITKRFKADSGIGLRNFKLSASN